MIDNPTYRGTIYPWHCDHMGHMNVMWYAGKFDDATWVMFSQLGLSAKFLRDNNRGMAAVEQNITYARELRPGDVIEINSTIIEVRTKVLRFSHQMHNIETGDVCATCELTAVHMDTLKRQAIALPPLTGDSAAGR